MDRARSSTTNSDFAARRPAELPDVEVLQGVISGASSVRHLHDDYRFGISVSGTWSTRYRGSDLMVGPGQIQLAQPGEVSSCEFPPTGRRAFKAITIAIKQVTEVSSDLYGSRRGYPVFPDHIATDAQAAVYFADAHRRLMGPASALETATVLQDVVAAFIQRFAAKRPAVLSFYSAPRAVKTARDFIEGNLTGNPTLAQLAEATGLSQFHLSRVFKRHLGLPPHAYQNHRRIQKAKGLLAAGYPGDDVAGQLGFFDQSHFIRQFKKQVGLTPQAYQQCIRQ